MNQNDYPQTWLSLSGICDKLRLSPNQVRQLERKGCLAVIGKNPTKRYLDPTPEYAEQLRLGAIIHQRHYPIPAGLNEKALLTNAECAELLGLTPKMMGRYLKRHSIESIRVSKNLFLYSPAVVRDAMLRRQSGGRYWRDKKPVSSQLAPFLIPELIEFFRSRLTAEVSVTPTDAEFAADEKLQLRLSKIVTESQKADFAQKVELARQIVQILDQGKGPLS